MKVQCFHSLWIADIEHYTTDSVLNKSQLESKGGKLRVARTEEGKVTLMLSCAPDGTDCSGTDDNEKVTVNMYSMARPWSRWKPGMAK